MLALGIEVSKKLPAWDKTLKQMQDDAKENETAKI